MTNVHLLILKFQNMKFIIQQMYVGRNHNTILNNILLYNYIKHKINISSNIIIYATKLFIFTSSINTIEFASDSATNFWSMDAAWLDCKLVAGLGAEDEEFWELVVWVRCFWNYKWDTFNRCFEIWLLDFNKFWLN